MVGAGQLFGANADTWKIGAGLCLAGMLVEFLSFSGFSIVVIIFGCRYRANKRMIPEPDYKIPIVNRILFALYINMAGQFVCPQRSDGVTVGPRKLPSARVLSAH
jgi:hypothetical protein